MTGARAASLAFCAVLAGCGAEAPPQWTPLSRAFAPEAIETPAPATSEPRAAPRLLREGAHAWIEATLDPTAWVYRRGLGAWACEVPVRGLGAPPAGTAPQRLTGTGRSYRFVPTLELGAGYVPAPGDFQLTAGVLFVVGDEARRPPADLRLGLYASRGRDAGGAWRVEGERFSGDALPVWPGEALERVVAPARGERSLRFATVLEPALTLAAGEPVVFRVRLDGALLFEHAVAAADVESYAWHAVDLPASAAAATLRFEVSGPPAFTSFMDPLVGPREVGAYGARPWDARPDLVVFLADTLRADGLSTFGGELDLTPALDAFAAESQRFSAARSVSTFTFPAHASLFSGLYPHQAGAVGVKNALPQSLATVAEVLARNGYRTGAITDSAMVSRRFGLDQGFAWFDEELIDLDSTLARARAFLDADDGRPVFLFVHTYRVHAPYHVSAETRRRFAGVLDFGPDYRTLEARLRELAVGPGAPDLSSAEARAIVAHMRDQYLGGIADLDRGFATFLDDLRARGLFPGGYLLFTSDHGESFDDHGELGHKGRVWEAQLRVPLLLAGPDLVPRTVTRPASLVDLPRTLAALARVLPDAGWQGRSLLAPGEDAPVFAFQAWGPPGEATLAVIDGPHKLITYEDPGAIAAGRLLGAFDLGEDPHELDDLADAPPAWVQSVLTRLGPRAAELLRPEVGAESAQLDAEKQAELGALGYGEEDGQ